MSNSGSNQYLGNPGMPAPETGTFANYMFGSDLAYGVHSMLATVLQDRG